MNNLTMKKWIYKCGPPWKINSNAQECADRPYFILAFQLAIMPSHMRLAFITLKIISIKMESHMLMFARCYVLVVSFYGCYILAFITAAKKMKAMMKIEQNMMLKEDTMAIVTITPIHILQENNFHKGQIQMKIISNRTSSMKLMMMMAKNQREGGAKQNFDGIIMKSAETDIELYFDILSLYTLSRIQNYSNFLFCLYTLYIICDYYI